MGDLSRRAGFHEHVLVHFCIGSAIMKKLLLLVLFLAVSRFLHAEAAARPSLSIATPCFPWNGEQTLCVPLDEVKPTRVFLVRHDGQVVCEGKRTGVSTQTATFDEFKAAVFSAAGCQVSHETRFFAVFAPDVKVKKLTGDLASARVRGEADAGVSCIGCDAFARVRGVDPNVSVFAPGESAPQFLHYPIPTYANGGRIVGPTVFVYGRVVQKMPGWCNTPPVLIESTGRRYVAYVTQGCEGGEQVFRAFGVNGPRALTALEDGRFGS